MLKIIIPLCAALGLTACAVSQNAITNMPLGGSEWAQGIEGQFVQFTGDGRVLGNGGCNRFSGSYTQEDTTISIGPLMSTKMACPRLSQETEFFNALNAARFADISHLELILKDEQGQIILTLRRQDWD